MSTTKPVLNYQRLLEITARLGPDDQEYVMRFVSNNDHKLQQRLEGLERERHNLQRDTRALREELEAKRRQEAAEHEQLLEKTKVAYKKLCREVSRGSWRRLQGSLSAILENPWLVREQAFLKTIAEIRDAMKTAAEAV